MNLFERIASNPLTSMSIMFAVVGGVLFFNFNHHAKTSAADDDKAAQCVMRQPIMLEGADKPVFLTQPTTADPLAFLLELPSGKTLTVRFYHIHSENDHVIGVVFNSKRDSTAPHQKSNDEYDLYLNGKIFLSNDGSSHFLEDSNKAQLPKTELITAYNKCIGLHH